MKWIFLGVAGIMTFLVFLFWGSFFEICWFPTRRKDYDRIAGLVRLQPGMIFYDLGSGTGDLLFYLSERYGIHCVGIEISPLLYLYSKVKSLFHKGVEIKYGSFLNQDLSVADVVYAFLHPSAYRKIKEKVLPKLRPTTKIVLSCWPFPDSKPIRASEGPGMTPYFLYEKTP